MKRKFQALTSKSQSALCSASELRLLQAGARGRAHWHFARLVGVTAPTAAPASPAPCTLALMNIHGHEWTTNARITHYQGPLCENPRVRLETVRTLKAATFLPTEKGPPDRDCEEVTGAVYSSRPDLTDVLQDPDLVSFTDGSSFTREGPGKAGSATTTAGGSSGPRPCRRAAGHSGQSSGHACRRRGGPKGTGRRRRRPEVRLCYSACTRSLSRQGTTGGGRKGNQERRRNPPTARDSPETFRSGGHSLHGPPERNRPPD